MTAGSRSLRLITFNPNPASVIARVRGLFAAEGLDVAMEVTPNSTEQMRGLGAGRWDVASTSFDNVLAWSGREGAEMLAIAQAMEGTYLPVYARPEVGGWTGLRGRPLAVDAVDTAYALVLRRLLLEHGLDWEAGDYTLVPVGSTGARLESMRRGETFAGILNPPWNARAEALGMVFLGDQSDVLPDYPGPVFAVSREWAEAHRDVVQAFLRAQVGALRWAHGPANQGEVVRLVASERGTGEREAAADLAKLPQNGALALRGLAAVLDLRVRISRTPPLGPDLTSYYDTSYYKAASGA